MAKMSIEELLTAVGELSVMELNDLVKQAEEKFGVSASAGVVMTTGGGGTEGGGSGPEAPSEFNVELTEVGAEKIKVIKAVRELTGLGLKEAKELVDNAPRMVKEGASPEDANAIKAKLEEVGAKVTLKP